MTLHLHIDRVVLDSSEPGFRLGPAQRAALAQALQRALGPAFADWAPGAWLLHAHVHQVDAGLLPVAGPPSQWAHGLAQGLRRGLAVPPSSRRRP